MTSKFFIATAAAALLALSVTPMQAGGNKTGHDTDTWTEETTTQGNSGKTNDNANPDNSGQETTTTTTTTSGPKGQLDKDNTDCNNCTSTTTTTSTGPGNSQH